jgi:N-methylhydantoinase A
MVDVHTVGAGGGSIGWADAGGALRVGPRSAGATPGPACYGRGGTEPTVTDATLLLGYLGTDAPLAGGVRLDRDAAHGAVAQLAQRLGLSVEEAARGIVRVADEEMLRALRVATVERGVDPRGYALVAFGGAGPMHAARLAEQLEIPHVICPQTAGVLSAVGLAAADRRRDAARTVLMSAADIEAGRAARVAHELAEQASTGLTEPQLEVTWELRYAGQAFELPVTAPADAPAGALRDGFERAHAERYGYTDPRSALELVTVRVSATQRRGRPEPAPALATESARRDTRSAEFDGKLMETAVLGSPPPVDEPVRGPAILELEEATVVVPPGWRARSDAQGAVVLARGGAG